jgi:hypothetical protein
MSPADSLGLPEFDRDGRSLTGRRSHCDSVQRWCPPEVEIRVFAAEPNGGLIPSPGTFGIAPSDELNRLAAQYRLPAIYGVPLPPPNGGLMSYGCGAWCGPILASKVTPTMLASLDGVVRRSNKSGQNE